MELPTAIVVGLTPVQMIGIPLALLGAVFMSLGAKFQHRGVTKVEHLSGQSAGAGLDRSHLFALLTRPSWLAGTLMIGCAIVLQLASLAFAPLIVVQPLGVVSLVITTLMTARSLGRPLTRQRVMAVSMCVIGVAIFVTTAAIYAQERPITQTQLLIVLGILAVIVALFAIFFATLRRRFKGLFYVLGAGVLYGFVATLAKVVINRVQNASFDWLTLLCLVALVTGTAVGAYFVQTAYASGPPDMVVAGLTVIDPIVAVLIGIVVLHEAAAAPWYAYGLFLIGGAIAVTGVFMIERGQTDDEIEAAKRQAIGAVEADAGGERPNGAGPARASGSAGSAGDRRDGGAGPVAEPLRRRDRD